MKIPKARKLPSGSWNIELQLGGKRRSITAQTKKECENKAALIKAEYRNGERITESSALTLRSAIDKYISERSNILSPSTIKGYRSIQNNRFQSVMNRRISTITNWQLVVNNEAKLINAKTLKNSWGFIKSVLRNEGVDVGTLAMPQVIANEQLFLDPDQIGVFLKAANGDRYEAAYLLALHSLRRSEIFALRSKDISDGFIHVHGATVQGYKQAFVDKETNKNSSSRRDIPLLISRLEELIPEDPDARIVPIVPDNIYIHLRNICVTSGLPEIRLHNLRHSFASLCYHLNISEQMTMRFGGWSDPNVMRKIYTHLAKKDQVQATNQLKDFFEKSE